MISVIVPVYKSEETLERCVKSLCAQTDSDLELLLIVDGPPDRSGILADELAKTDARIRVINQENQGVSRARNRGISEAKGEYIRFVDSDDYVDADSNQRMLALMQKENLDFVVAGFHHLYFGRDILKCPKEGIYEIKNLSASDAGEIRKLYIDGFLNMPWNKLYKREKMKTLFPTDLNLGEDLLFNQAYMKGTERMGVLSYPVCNYIQDDRGTTLSTKKRMDKIPIAFRLCRETTAFFKELGMDDENMPATKAVIEFLDDLEGLAFDGTLTKKDKLSAIVRYKEALDELGEAGRRPKLLQLDYRMIFWFYKRGCIGMVYFLVQVRGLIVRALKKRG